MKNNGLRKYYFEKKLKGNLKQFLSDKKVERLSMRQITKSDLKKPSNNLQKSLNKEKSNFNELIKLNIKKKLFSNEEDKENNNLNKNTSESKKSKDKQEKLIKKDENNLNYGNYGYSTNNNYNKNNLRLNKYNKLKLRYSTPLCIETNYNTNNEKDIKKEKCYKMNYNNTGINIDFEIDDLINSTTSKIENEKEQKISENYEFKKYLEEVKKTQLSKNNLTKGTLAIIHMQISNAKEAILSNKYISYINIVKDKDNVNDKNNICFRLGKNNMCVCGHGFSRHYLSLGDGEFKSNCKKCKCKKCKYIPVFPEETNEYTKAYLLDFKYDDWKAGCKCGHNWTKHNFINEDKCEECNCEGFKSNFCCGVCGNPWENHITLFQTKEQREKNGESVGNDYEPFTQEQLENLMNN